MLWMEWTIGTSWEEGHGVVINDVIKLVTHFEPIPLHVQIWHCPPYVTVQMSTQLIYSSLSLLLHLSYLSVISTLQLARKSPIEKCFNSSPRQNYSSPFCRLSTLSLMPLTPTILSLSSWSGI